MKRILFIFIIVQLLQSCQHKVEQKNIVFIDYSNDSLDYKYKLRILDTVDNEYFDDKYGYTIVKCEKKIYVNDSCFGNETNFEKAKQYASEIGFADIWTKTTISLPLRKDPEKYKEVWRLHQYASYNSEFKEYTTTDAGRFELKQGEINFNNKLIRCFKIVREEPYAGDDVTQILSFVKLKTGWETAKREKISIEKKINGKKVFSYCVDTICRCPDINKGVFEINWGCFYDNDMMTCY